jgi:hypothetical protein
MHPKIVIIQQHHSQNTLQIWRDCSQPRHLQGAVLQNVVVPCAENVLLSNVILLLFARNATRVNANADVPNDNNG